MAIENNRYTTSLLSSGRKQKPPDDSSIGLTALPLEPVQKQKEKSRPLPPQVIPVYVEKIRTIDSKHASKPIEKTSPPAKSPFVKLEKVILSAFEPPETIKNEQG